MQSGPEQFTEWMARKGLSQREAAAYFSWDETFISKLCRGRRRPGLSNSVKIYRVTGIPMESWLASRVDDLEYPKLKRARKSKRTR